MSTIPGTTVAGTTGTQNSTNTGTTSTSSSASGTGASLAGNFSTFLNLLTTQLQNQDPTSPVDSNQFTQQLVEFAGVQQQVQSNTYLQQILAATQSNQVGSASSYIGTSIQATGDQTSLTSGSTASFGYTLSSAASNVAITIKDSTGNTVFTGTGTGNSGSNLVAWDGLNSFTGASEPSGVYTVSVSAKDTNGTALTATPFITGTVQSASVSNGVVDLSLGNGLEVPTTSVTSISNLPGSSSGSGLSSAISSLASEIASLPSTISSDVSSDLSSLL